MIVLLPNGPSVHSQMALLLTPNSHKKVARDSKFTTTFTLFTCNGKITQKVSIIIGQRLNALPSREGWWGEG